VQDLYDELDVDVMHGSFMAIPVMNGPAFAAARRESPWDYLNLARVFPGSPTGSPTMQIAHAFRAHLLPQADLLLDIHSGGNAYAIKSLAGYQIRPGSVGEMQRGAAIAFGLDLVWGTGGLPGRTLSAAGDLGIPAVYVEMRGEGRCRPQDLATAKQGTRNVLAYLGIIEGTYPTESPRYLVEMPAAGSGHLQVDHPSPVSGIFVPAADLWERVTVGQVLGAVRHPNGQVLAQIPAARDGRILFLRTLPRVFSGNTVAFVLALPDGVD
ncbi:MAG: succinylglutamate desuccinylase/aspartoacylase family protein, partial [bacterium]